VKNKKIQIALVRVPTIIDSSASTAPVCPPIGMAYLKSVLNDFAEKIVIVDSIGNFPKTRMEELNGHRFNLLGQNIIEIVDCIDNNPDMIFVSCMFSQDWLYAKALIKKIKNKFKDSILIVGGEHVTALPKYCLDQVEEIDVAVIGEGENTVSAFVEQYIDTNFQMPLNISGTFVRHPRGTVFENSRREREREIDSISWPDWDGFPLKNYFEGHHGFGVNLGSRSMPIMASRGCPFKCTFCSSPLMWTTLWKARQPKDLIDEILFYKKKYNVDNFDFYDLTAIVKRSWIIEFCNLLIDEQIDITWQLPSGTRSEALDMEVAELLYISGCRNLSYAPESGSQEVLRTIKKKIDFGNMLSSMRACVKVGMNIKANLICGFPEENWRHLFESFVSIVKMAWVGCHDLSINQYSPYPGSELFDELVKDGVITFNDEYFIQLSYYSSMSNSVSYSKYLSNRDILIYKYAGTLLFYFISFLIRPWRVVQVVRNVINNNETSRLEKTLLSYIRR